MTGDALGCAGIGCDAVPLFIVVVLAADGVSGSAYASCGRHLAWCLRVMAVGDVATVRRRAAGDVPPATAPTVPPDAPALFDVGATP